MMIRQRNKLSKFKYEQINNQISKYSIDMSEKWKPKGKYLEVIQKYYYSSDSLT
jgi:hypothetical protein